MCVGVCVGSAGVTGLGCLVTANLGQQNRRKETTQYSRRASDQHKTCKLNKTKQNPTELTNVHLYGFRDYLQ